MNSPTFANPVPKKEFLLAFSGLFLLVCVWFSPWILSGRVLAPLDWLNEVCLPWRTDAGIHVNNHFVSDCALQVLTLRKTAEESFRESGFLGWDDRTLCGSAQHANTTWYAYDWTMQLHRFLSFWQAWHIGLMGQFFIGGLGMFFLLRGRGIGAWAAFPCAIAFMGNSQFVHWMYHRHGIGGFCWVPWLIHAVDRWRSGHRAAFAAAVFFFMMAALGLSLQYHAMLFLVVAGGWMGWAMQERAFSDKAAWTARIFVLGVLGFAASAFMLWPCTVAFFENNAGGHTRGMFGYAEGFKQPILNLVSYAFNLLPTPLGRPSSMDAWKIFSSDMFDVAYIGFLPALLGLLGLLKKRAPADFRIWAVLGILVTLTPFVGFLYRRALVVSVFGFVCCAAWWLSTVSPDDMKKTGKRILLVASACVVLWASASAVLVWKKDLLLAKVERVALSRAKTSLTGDSPAWYQARSVRFLSELPVWFPENLLALLTISAGAATLYSLGSGKISREAAGAFLSVIVAVEVTSYSARWATWADLEKYPFYGETPLQAKLKKSVGAGRLLLEEGSLAGSFFPPNTLAPSGISTANGYESIKPNGMTAFYNSDWLDAPTNGRMGVTHALLQSSSHGATPPGWAEVWRMGNAVLVRNPAAFPRYAGLPDAWDQNVSLSDTAALSESVHLRNFRRIAVPAGISLVRVAENFGVGWQYRIVPGPWKNAEPGYDNSMLLTLPPPAANPRTVEMRYIPVLAIRGAAVSILAFLVVAALLLVPQGRRLICPNPASAQKTT